MNSRTLAILPDGPGPITFFDVSTETPVFVGQVDVEAPFAPLRGGSPAVDPVAGVLYLPITGGRKVVSVTAPRGP